MCTVLCIKFGLEKAENVFLSAPSGAAPLASGESSQASCEDIFRTTCRETPNPICRLRAEIRKA